MTSHLEALGRRVEGDPFFLAMALKDYAQSEKLDDGTLAKALGCSKDTLTMLRLCRTPDEASFKADIERIASRFSIDRVTLAQVARRGQVLLHMRRDTPSDHGMLLAARDDDEVEPKLEPPESRP